MEIIMRLDDMFDIARTAANAESVSSQLPGRGNGPADAYRHILWVAEMTRRFGESVARNIAGLNTGLNRGRTTCRRFAIFDGRMSTRRISNAAGAFQSPDS